MRPRLVACALTAILAHGCATLPHATTTSPIRAPETAPCTVTASEHDWLAQNIYPRMARDIPRIIAKGWAKDVSEQDLYHAHVYVRELKEEYPVDPHLLKTVYRSRVSFLYHSKEWLDDPKKRNIYVGPWWRFHARDDIVITTPASRIFEPELGKYIDMIGHTIRAARRPEGKEIIQVNFATTFEELRATIVDDRIDRSSVEHIGAYWFGVYRKFDSGCN